MLERTQIFVDTSYLLASFYNSWETGARAQLEIDLPEVVSTLGSMVEAHLKQPVHRQLWYDGIPDSGPHRYQRALRTCDGVQLRAGQLIEWGERRTQKGVDTRLVADMVLAAVRRDFTDLVLVSGDADMIPGVQEAVEAGIRVHLYAFGWESMSSALRHCCDTTTILDPREDFEASMHIEVLEGPLPPVIRTPQDGVDLNTTTEDDSPEETAPNNDGVAVAGSLNHKDADISANTNAEQIAAPDGNASDAREAETHSVESNPSHLESESGDADGTGSSSESNWEIAEPPAPTPDILAPEVAEASRPRATRPGEPPLSAEDSATENTTHGSRYAPSTALRTERFGREQARRSTSNSVTEERDGTAHRITVTSTVEESVELTLPHFQGNYPSSSLFQRPANQGLEQEMAEEDAKEAQDAASTPKPSDMRPTAPKPAPNPSMMAGRRKLRSRYVPLPSEVWSSGGNQTPFDVGQQYALWWYENAATDAQRDSAHLLSGGGLPPEIDRPLLQFACETLHEYTLTESQRVVLRDGFHSGIRGILVNSNRKS
ncbi:MAG: NYN domain-containing protein [Corynebacterium sp.]|nr:NYN domain-containing protein [Corynebacterium sp.]